MRLLSKIYKMDLARARLVIIRFGFVVSELKKMDYNISGWTHAASRNVTGTDKFPTKVGGYAAVNDGPCPQP